MNKTFFKNPLVLVIIGFVLALLPFLFDNEGLLVMLRLLSFVIIFYAVHLFFKQRRVAKK